MAAMGCVTLCGLCGEIGEHQSQYGECSESRQFAKTMSLMNKWKVGVHMIFELGAPGGSM